MQISIKLREGSLEQVHIGNTKRVYKFWWEQGEQ